MKSVCNEFDRREVVGGGMQDDMGHGLLGTVHMCICEHAGLS